ncbi:MAG: hypothetical protein ACM3QW_07330 [Ignavibacteriales bacterium]
MRVLDEVEKYLIRLVVFGLIALVTVQGAMTSDSIKFYLSLGEHLEGKNVEAPAAAVDDLSAYTMLNSDVASITIDTVDYTSLNKAFLVVNGHRQGNFSEGRLTTDVSSGDVIEIDTSWYSHPVQFKVVRTSSNLRFPSEGFSITADQSMTVIGKTILK